MMTTQNIIIILETSYFSFFVDKQNNLIKYLYKNDNFLSVLE